MTHVVPRLALPALDFTSVQSVALAISGGSDSSALMKLAVLARSGAFRNVALVAFTVDHGLREGSAGEAAMVARWCAEHGIFHETLRWHGEIIRSGLQAAARKARYDLMTDRCAAMGCGVLMTAHTADDQAETVAMRMTRTDSPKSLAGIWPSMTWNGITVCRPLLHERRETLRAFLRDVGQPWIEDPSNDDLRFERVRVRKSLAAGDVPILAARAEAAITTAMANSAEATAWLEDHPVSHFGHVQFSRMGFASQPVAVQCEILSNLLAMLGGKPPLRAQLRELAAHLRGSTFFRRTLGGGLVSARKCDVIICREASRVLAEVIVPAGGTVLWDARFQITAPSGAVIRPLGRAHARASYGCPSYVAAALPEVLVAGNPPVTPHFQPGAGISVRLSERFGL